MKPHAEPAAFVPSPAAPRSAARLLLADERKSGCAPPLADEVEMAMSQLEIALWLLLAESVDEATFWQRFSRMLEACVIMLPADGAARVYRHADGLLARAGLPAWTVVQQHRMDT